MVTKAVSCALVVTFVTAAAAAAQEPPPAPPPTPPVSAPPAVQPPAPAMPAAAVPVPARDAALDVDTIRRRRDQISIMEGVLARAVRNAAQQIARELETPETGPFQLSGTLGARGFILEGYGVFFHVDIPGVQPSLISPISLEAIRKYLSQPGRPQAERASAGTAEPGRPANPNADYVERVKDALIKAMIEYSKPLELQPSEWFAVAAGDGDEPHMPAVLAEQSMMLLRIRGGDIAEYMAGRLTLDDVRKRVDVRKF